MRTVAYAGSFDPITNGHVHIIKKALKLFDEVVLVVTKHPDKKGNWPLDLRARVCQQVIDDVFKGRGVRVETNDMYLTGDYLKQLRIDCII